jgi:DNA-binding NarL/FixJ family response regulator
MEELFQNIGVTMEKKIFRIVLADDHPLMRESIATYIEDHCANQLKVVDQAGDGVAAIEAVERHKPDIALMDLGMPRLDGVSAVRKIKATNPGIQVVVFSMYEDQSHVVEAIRAGADDYLFKKDATAAAVVGHLLRILGGTLPPQDTLRRRLFQAVRGADEDDVDSGFTKLTGAELEVLKLAAHRGFTMKEIAEHLGEKGAGPTENTIRKHLEHIYEKLGAKGQTHAVCLAVKYGLISADEAEPDLNSK